MREPFDFAARDIDIFKREIVEGSSPTKIGRQYNLTGGQVNAIVCRVYRRIDDELYQVEYLSEFGLTANDSDEVHWLKKLKAAEKHIERRKNEHLLQST